MREPKFKVGDTVVAFEGYNSQGEYFYCVCENCWGTTTGKHLNWIDSNKNNRLKRDEFKTKLNQFLQ